MSLYTRFSNTKSEICYYKTSNQCKTLPYTVHFNQPDHSIDSVMITGIKTIKKQTKKRRQIILHKYTGNQDRSDSSTEEEEPNEEEIIRAADNTKIYITKVLKSSTTNLAKKKKDPRVYNTRHFCTLCKNFTKDFAQHLNAKSHARMPAVVEMKDKPPKERKRLITILRLEGASVRKTKEGSKGKVDERGCIQLVLQKSWGYHQD